MEAEKEEEEENKERRRRTRKVKRGHSRGSKQQVRQEEKVADEQR